MTTKDVTQTTAATDATEEAGKKATQAAAAQGDLEPVILDVGSVTRRSINLLKQGRGNLLEEVDAAIEEIKADLAGQLAGRDVLPVIVLCRERSSDSRTVRVPMMPWATFSRD
jgi:hypothetical protein